jgi:hypothetical protein
MDEKGAGRPSDDPLNSKINSNRDITVVGRIQTAKKRASMSTDRKRSIDRERDQGRWHTHSGWKHLQDEQEAKRRST